MPLSALVEDGITGAEGLVQGTGAAIRTWANANPTNLPGDASLTFLPGQANATAIRGVLLGYLAFGKRDKAVVAAFRDLIKAWPPNDLTAELKAYYDFSKVPAQGVILMPSFRHANSANKENAKSTLAAATKAMMKAYLAATQGRQADGDERAKMAEWFGAFDDARYGTVVTNLKSLTDVLGATPIRVYYRGSNIKGPSDKPNEPGAAPKKEAFASAHRSGVIPASFDRAFAHITLGEKFFNYRADTAGVGAGISAQVAVFGAVNPNLTRPTTAFASTSGTNSTAGVLIHELSHHICDTQDIELPANHPTAAGKKCYGQVKCKWLATNVPADAIRNADSYEYYFEQFQ